MSGTIAATTNYALRLGFWLGPDAAEAQRAYIRAMDAGMSKSRSEAIGHVASRRDCWAFARHIAARVGVSVRTIQRAFAQAKSLGLIGIARGKKGEVPPGANAPIDCGWSHRWTIGRGLGGALLKCAIDGARAVWFKNLVARKTVPLELAKLARKTVPPAELTTAQKAVWIDQQLADLDAKRKARDGP